MSPNQADVGGVPTFRACNFRFPSFPVPIPHLRSHLSSYHVTSLSPRISSWSRDPSSRDAKLFRVVEGRKLFIRREFSRVYKEISRRCKLRYLGELIRELGQSFILRELSVPSSLDWPSPSFEESFPTPSKVIDDDKILPLPNRRLSRVVPSTRISQIPNSLRSSPIFSAVKSIVGGDLSRAMGSRPTKARAGNSGSRNYRHFFPRPRNLPLKCRFRITSRHGSL